MPPRPGWHVVLSAATAAAVGGAALIAFFQIHPDITFEMDRDLPPRVTSGFYPPELAGDEFFSWTMDRAQINVQNVDRRTPWTCVARVRSARPPGNAAPAVTLSMDGETLVSRLATDDYQDLTATTPAHAGTGLKFAIVSAPTFAAPGDPRQLGVRVDRVSCGPVGWTLPSRASLATAAAVPAVLALAFALVGMRPRANRVASSAAALLCAWPLSKGLGPYTIFLDRAMWLAIWIALSIAAGGTLARWRTRHPLSDSALAAIAVSAIALLAKLLALLHPSKAVVDAVFHAHRLDFVLSGRYFFTQLMPAGIQFPYAIALYVFASPWASFTRDHVALLRIVVSAAEAGAGLCLYWAVVRTWRDPILGLWAVVFYHVLPVSYWVVGNANLTNAFGQSAALVAMTAAIVWPLEPRQWWQAAALAALTAVGLLSHVSTGALLAATMACLAVLFWWRAAKTLAKSALSILAALAASVLLAVTIYYGRPEFYPAYRSARDARAADVRGGASSGAPATAPVPGVAARIAAAVVQSRGSIGWPILILAGVGLWRITAERRTDRLALAIAAWGAAFVIFMAFGIAAPGRVGQQRYALEFVARAAYASSPAAIVLAAEGAAWLVRRRPLLRVIGAILALAALVAAGREWAGWLR